MAGEEDSFALGRQSARAEALGLYQMLGHDGNTVESIRELIAVQPKIERVLLAFAQVHPEEAYSIDRNLKFRLSVSREFERLVREGLPVAALQEVEESDLDGSEKTFARRAGVMQKRGSRIPHGKRLALQIRCSASVVSADPSS